MTNDATQGAGRERGTGPWRWWLALGLGLALGGCATTPADVRARAAPGDDRAADRVTPSLYSTNAAVRQAAIDELVKMKNSEAATEALLSATISPDPAVRGDVGAAVLFSPQAELNFYAITLVADKDPMVRKRMAEGLAAAGRKGPYQQTREAGIYLWGLEQDTDPQVRAAAAKGLGELGLQDPMDFALAALRTDPEPRVRAAAAAGLGTPAREYLAGKPGPGWGDAQVQQFLATQVGGTLPTPVQTRGEEIVTALCKAATKDDGAYVEVVYTQTLFGRNKHEVKHWVAAAAAEALVVPGQTPRADVAAAETAAQARVRSGESNTPTPAKTVVIHQARGMGS